MEEGRSSVNATHNVTGRIYSARSSECRIAVYNPTYPSSGLGEVCQFECQNGRSVDSTPFYFHCYSCTAMSRVDKQRRLGAALSSLSSRCFIPPKLTTGQVLAWYCILQYSILSAIGLVILRSPAKLLEYCNHRWNTTTLY
jgi:hypothetical protein